MVISNDPIPPPAGTDGAVPGAVGSDHSGVRVRYWWTERMAMLPLADRGGDTFDRSVPDVTGREDARLYPRTVGHHDDAVVAPGMQAGHLAQHRRLGTE